MKIVIFGATGMVGKAALKQALNSNDVSEVLVVGRSALPEQPKLKQLILKDFTAPNTLEECTRFTYDFTLDITRALVENNPNMHFIYMSGAGYNLAPLATTYCASKYYVSAFCEGLAHEMKMTGGKLQAKVLTPASTKTAMQDDKHHLQRRQPLFQQIQHRRRNGRVPVSTVLQR